MSLHRPPQTDAEHFALHLETQYGIQLDPTRHALFLTEIEAFAVKVKASALDSWLSEAKSEAETEHAGGTEQPSAPEGDSNAA